jgi:hypothetical protein
MLRLPEWDEYIKGHVRSLWLHGIPGAGKTVLMAHLIGKIQDHCREQHGLETACTYYYCYFGHNQDECGHLLRSVINQLCRRNDHVAERVYQMFKKGGQPSTVELLDALEQVLGQFRLVYLCIDALDESNERGNLLNMLQALSTEARFSKIRILSSSREYADIIRIMTTTARPVSMSNPYVENDIRLCVETMLKSNKRFQRWPTGLLNDVVETVPAKAKGMSVLFLLIVCSRTRLTFS